MKKQMQIQMAAATAQSGVESWLLAL